MMGYPVTVLVVERQVRECPQASEGLHFSASAEPLRGNGGLAVVSGTPAQYLHAADLAPHISRYKVVEANQ